MLRSCFHKISLTSLLAFAIPANVHADVLYDSITQSIQSVEAQAYVYLASGRYAADNGRSRIIWNVPQDTRSTIRFRYALGTIQSGLIDFQSGTSFVIRSGSLCSKITVRKISVLPGGAIDKSASDYTLDPPSNQCREPRSQLETALEDVVSLQIDPAKTFAGNVFSGSGKLHACPNEACAGSIDDMPMAQPVTKFVAFSTDGNKATSAFAVDLRQGASLQLPKQAGYVKLSSGSGVQILNATYDVKAKSGSGLMQKLRVTAEEGILNFGSAVLNLTSGSELAFENVSIAQQKDVTTVTNGTLTGTLGGNSFLTLILQGSHKSSISLAQASATLTGLQMEFRENKASLSGKSGDLKITANSADLYLSENMHLLLGSTSIGLVFGCPAAEAECLPFAWSNDGSITAVGHILPIASSLKGGYITFPGQNQLQVDAGEIQTADLQLDSRNKVTPITGSLQKIDLKFSAQNWQVDQSVRIGTATLHLSSQDFSVVPGDAFPVGKVKFDGQISEITAGGIGRIALANGQTTISIDASRKAKDDLKIDDGSINGKLKFRGEDIGTGGDASFTLHDLLYYRGVGSAKLIFYVEDANAHIPTPSDHSENGFPGGRTVVDVASRDIQLKLNKRVGFSDADVKVNNGVWSIGQQIGLPIDVAASVATGELVNLNVQLGGGDLDKGYNTVCSPHVNINRGSYTLNAKADLTLSSTARRFSIRDVGMTPAFDADVDDRGCKYVAVGICGIIGGLATGGLGAIAAGIACGNEVDKYKGQMNDKIKTTAADKLRDLKLDLSF